MEGTNSAPDLQSILSTLARFVPPVQTTGAIDAGDRVSTPNFVPLEHTEPTAPLQPVVEKAEDPRLRPQSRSAPSPKPIDPATITTWQDGLRCVTKIAAQSAHFAVSIRKMMEDQRKNEMRWYSERQALKQTQAKRASSTAQAKSILQSLGGSGGEQSAAGDSVVDNDAELTAFDCKIYAAQQDMDSAMTAEMKSLGVPFFGTDRSLVVPDGEESIVNQPGTRSKWSPTVTETQLLELRRRMVGHLEDLYKD